MTVTVQQAFNLALQHHQAVRLAEAEAIDRQILSVQPNHSDALNLLGLIAKDTGRTQEAENWIRKAIATSPSIAAFHTNLGTAR